MDACDVLANVLAVICGVADEDRRVGILRYLIGSSAVDPFPARSYEKPVTEDDDRWQMLSTEAERHQVDRWRNPPHRYHNAGVWPFIGGLLVAALSQVGLVQEATEGLGRLASANRLGGGPASWGFPEWIDSRTGEARGASGQAWSAAGFVYAAMHLRRAMQ